MQLNAATRRRAGFLFFRTLIYKDICVMILGRVKNYVSVAQGTEHRSPKAGVGGSNPLRDTTTDLFELLLLSRRIRRKSTDE